ALLGLTGFWMVGRWVDPLTSYRIGPMTLTAITSGVIYLYLARLQGYLAGLTAALAFAFLPRTFAHAHYAHYDMPVTCLWLLTQLAFLKTLQSHSWSVPFGILLGLAAATKLTGWLAVLPALSWWALCEGTVFFHRLLQKSISGHHTQPVVSHC